MLAGQGRLQGQQKPRVSYAVAATAGQAILGASVRFNVASQLAERWRQPRRGPASLLPKQALRRPHSLQHTHTGRRLSTAKAQLTAPGSSFLRAGISTPLGAEGVSAERAQGLERMYTEPRAPRPRGRPEEDHVGTQGWAGIWARAQNLGNAQTASLCSPKTTRGAPDSMLAFGAVPCKFPR